MAIKLKKSIVFFDLETTGLKISHDRIVEISALKISKDNQQESKTWRVNPTIPISKEASEIHGIYDSDVANEKTFLEIADEVYSFIKNCDLGGYNLNKFDIPLLGEEFIRCNIHFNFDNVKSIDVQNIFHKLEQRTLAAAYQFYCNKKLENAHSAEADTKATFEILLAQIEKYQQLENNVEYLSEFSMQNGKSADLAGFIKYNKKNEMIISFGKYKNTTLKEIWDKNPGYFSWIKNADFPKHTKQILEKFVNETKLNSKLN